MGIVDNVNEGKKIERGIYETTLTMNVVYNPDESDRSVNVWNGGETQSFANEDCKRPADLCTR
jgi:hypothetical protein